MPDPQTAVEQIVTASPEDLSSFWAKLGADRVIERGYHPLLCHMVDCAEVARLLLRTRPGSISGQTLAASLGLSESAGERWITFFAGLHDLGKAYPGFQGRDTEFASRFPGNPSLEMFQGDPVPHGMITAWSLARLLPEQFGTTKVVATRVAVLTGGHHGSFPEFAALQKITPKVAGGPAWEQLRRRLTRTVADLLEVPSPPPTKICHAAAMILAGLISVADWICSSERYFPYAAPSLKETPALDLPAYRKLAAAQATRALNDLGWITPTPPPEPRTFTTLFPGRSPRPLQQQADALAPRLHHPALVLIEAPMGEGKTEAALSLADTLAAQGSLSGLYFALPTQATSNQMFQRLCVFLQNTSSDSRVQLQLLHGHASLSAEFQLLLNHAVAAFEPTSVDGGSQEAALIASEWFTHRKRGLLSAFGVGTVDQILLAVLQTRHVFVRLFGLSGKVVVIDEVHAYDAYMTTLLKRLLAWLGAVGTSVVMLSATLPSSRRQELVDAYSRGLGLKGDATLPPATYPRITWLTRESGPNAETFYPSAALRRTVDLLHITRGGNWASDLATRLRQALQDGGCAVVICNTVARAQQAFTELQASLADGGAECPFQVDLLHSRFPFDERQAREAHATERFGPPESAVRPHRAVLISTQIVEQSLDLDFDLMVTDIAPVDLLLQRSGRLHRHLRSRPPGLSAPALWVLMPQMEEDGVPAIDPGDRAVYATHVLFRTWLTLLPRTSLGVPDDIETLVEAVYREQGMPPDLTAAGRRLWEESAQAMKKGTEREQNEAENRWLKPPWANCALEELTKSKLEEDALGLHQAHQALTRLADPSVQVVLMYGHTSGLFTHARGGVLVDPTIMPGGELTVQLLRRSVTLTDRRVVHHLLEEPVPLGWKSNALLRHHRLIILDDSGSARLGNCRLRLHPDLGLVITEDSSK